MRLNIALPACAPNYAAGGKCWQSADDAAPARRPQTGARMRLVAMLALLTAHPSRIADHEELSLADFAQLGGDKRLEDAKKEILDAVDSRC